MARYRLDSLSDFARQRYNLRVTCNDCGHVVEASSGEMMRELGPVRARFPMARLEDKMRCSRCGHKGASIAACEPTF